jgi:glycerol-3-phosphate O-acyltransferase
VPDSKRIYLDYYRNAILNRYVGLSLVSTSVRSRGAGASLEDVRDDVRFLSRLFRLEFMYPVGASFDAVFRERLGVLVQLGVVRGEGGVLSPGPERGRLEFLSDLVRPYLEAYRVAAETVRSAGTSGGAVDRKALVKQALERGGAEFLSGHVLMRESVSKATLENAMEWLGTQGAFAIGTDGKRGVSRPWLDEASTQLLGP